MERNSTTNSLSDHPLHRKLTKSKIMNVNKMSVLHLLTYSPFTLPHMHLCLLFLLRHQSLLAIYTGIQQPQDLHHNPTRSASCQPHPTQSWYSNSTLSPTSPISKEILTISQTLFIFVNMNCIIYNNYYYSYYDLRLLSLHKLSSNSLLITSNFHPVASIFVRGCYDRSLTFPFLLHLFITLITVFLHFYFLHISTYHFYYLALTHLFSLKNPYTYTPYGDTYYIIIWLFYAFQRVSFFSTLP